MQQSLVLRLDPSVGEVQPGQLGGRGRALGAAMQKTDWGLVASRLGLLAALSLVCVVFATRAFANYQRSL